MFLYARLVTNNKEGAHYDEAHLAAKYLPGPTMPQTGFEESTRWAMLGEVSAMQSLL
jgi:hypothetical protein